jgi:phosphoribosylformimino-5-aminoimidazole carboxamide ribonucleotide (ProFAR) isomerase
MVAQDYDAGRHTGKIGTMNLIPEVADAVCPIPVLGAGGIGDGRGLVAILALGAAGVWCGTAPLRKLSPRKRTLDSSQHSDASKTQVQQEKMP